MTPTERTIRLIKAEAWEEGAEAGATWEAFLAHHYHWSPDGFGLVQEGSCDKCRELKNPYKEDEDA